MDLPTREAVLGPDLPATVTPSDRPAVAVAGGRHDGLTVGTLHAHGRRTNGTARPIRAGKIVVIRYGECAPPTAFDACRISGFGRRARGRHARERDTGVEAVRVGPNRPAAGDEAG